MPQKCTVCAHPQSHEIDLAIIRGEMSNRRIASQFGLGERAVRDHRKNHLAEKIQQSQAIVQKVEAIDLNRELATLYSRVRNYFESCHEYLLDPDDPTRYNLSARGEEISVIYEEIDAETGKPKRKKARLHTLIKKIEEGLGITVLACEVRHADIRKLFLESSKQLLDEIERIGIGFGLLRPSRLDTEILETLRVAVESIRADFRRDLKIDLSWEEAIDRIMPLYPKKRAYLEKLREEGPEPSKEWLM